MPARKWGTQQELAVDFALKGKERQMGFGVAKHVVLSDAREEAERCGSSSRMANPIEPQDRTRCTGDAKAEVGPFEWCATEYMKAHEAGWRNAKHRQQWQIRSRPTPTRSSAKLPVDAIDTGLVMQICN